MTRKTLFAFLATAAIAASGQTFKEWQNADINEVNRLPMHTDFPAWENQYASEDNSLGDNAVWLNGTWKFNWVESADQRPTDFWRTDFNDKGWGTIPVPGLWELNGYGDAQYVNTRYAWHNFYKDNPPYAPVEHNHVGSYRREIEIPASMIGKQLIARFGSVTSNIYLWVNGKFVGYSEDSKLECEFDVTPYLKAGKNLVAFQVFRWCDGTYYECQDFWRFSGVARDSYIYARSKANHIDDIVVDQDLDATYTNATLDVTVKSTGNGTVDLVLSDAAGKAIAQGSAKAGKCHFDIKNPLKWTAETPNLYTLTATLTAGGKVEQKTSVPVGFRKIEIKNSQVLVNGKAVLFKGADRHEMDPDGGYVVSRERMLQDIKIMKENNINAVRTCHYPDDDYWYYLCDKYGIYVCAEANVEGHGMGYNEKTLAKNPVYLHTTLERNRRHVQHERNHPSIIFWSLGNETGFGDNFVQAYNLVKKLDPSRPVQYERAGLDDATDIYCPMYASPEDCIRYCENNDAQHSKPFIQCEYAHAMGNSEGGFKEYWDVIRKYPKYQGGFIWDFVDQSVRGIGKNGKEVYKYGGDFNAYDAHDENFLDNGLISPDRVPNPHMDEVRYFYQNIWAEAVDLSKGRISVFNENFFAGTENVRLVWSLVADGKQVQSGSINNLNINPQTTSQLVLPYDLSNICPKSEVMLNIEFVQKNTQNALQAGWVVARRQLPVQGNFYATERKIDNKAGREALSVNNDNTWRLIVSSNVLHAEFDKNTGFLVRYDVSGQPMLDGALTPNFWRASTDNDFGANLNVKLKVWQNPTLKLTDLSVNEKDGLALVTAKYDMPEVKAALVMEYTINGDGVITLHQAMTASKSENVPMMVRFGVQLQMPQNLDYSEYYGRGPIENYPDRNNSTFLGVYRQTADEQAYPYIRPQETGTKTDMRWWKQTTRGGKGLLIESNQPFLASALHYSVESLHEGDTKIQRHFPEVDPVPYTNLLIDSCMMGLGCIDSWGAIPYEQYRLPYADRSLTIRLTPTK